LNRFTTRQHSPSTITFYHDTEQNYDSNADPLECRNMINEFLKLEKKYNIPTTYNVVGKLFEEQPDLIENIINEGQEVAFHSYNHQKDWNPEYFSSEIALCRKASRIPVGYRSPRSQINAIAVQTVWEKGFLWNAEGDYHTEPYFIYKGLVRLPITGDDWSVGIGEVTAEKWVHNFSRLLKSRTYIAFGLHDYIASFDPDKILKAWEKILQIGIESGALLLNFSETAELYRRTALSRNLKFQNGNNITSKVCISVALESLIKKETEKLNNPVIANIFFGNKNLSSFLKEISAEIHYIQIDIDLDIIGILESTDSTPQNNFANLIICTNCIEYQFWPDNLADIIKQISKIGATYIVTFPSITNEHPASILEKIKHSFTKDEIQEWSKQIGPGNIICLYDIAVDDELINKRESHVKLEIDSNKTFWVFIGKVQNQNISYPKRRSISISEAAFHFPNPVYESIRINLEIIKGKLLNTLRKVGKIILINL
jgi:hypothetical protein